MKKLWLGGVLICLSFGTSALALPSSGVPSSYVSGEIVRVEKRTAVSPPYAGLDTPTDAPLHSNFYVFDLSVRVNCQTYKTSYESLFNFLPSSYAAGQSLNVRTTKRRLYFFAPDGEEMQLRRIRHQPQHPESCAETSQK
jgi:hypothetical protein